MDSVSRKADHLGNCRLSPLSTSQRILQIEEDFLEYTLVNNNRIKENLLVDPSKRIGKR